MVRGDSFISMNAPEDPIAYYPFNRNAHDVIGGIDGTVNGNPSIVGGILESAYHFDGNNDYISFEGSNDYMDFNKRALEFSNLKREIIANNLFDYGYDIICNQPHQFLKDYNNMYLGSNCTDVNCDKIKSEIFPTTLRADIAAYLFRGKKNLSEVTLKNQNLFLLFTNSSSASSAFFCLSASLIRYSDSLFPGSSSRAFSKLFIASLYCF